MKERKGVEERKDSRMEYGCLRMIATGTQSVLM